MRAALALGLILLGAAVPAVHAAEVKYLLWDSTQLPAYRQCANDFARQHPGTTVKIRQYGWGDYWSTISMGFIADSAPDVFTNHLTKYPEIARHGLLLDLAPLIRRDGLDATRYKAGLFDVWRREGRQYGLPKDWDTIALAVNLTHARRAGVTLAELRSMDWNPRDGGSFERIVRRLTVDAQSRPGTHPAFDKTRVRVFGYQNPGAGGMMAQTEWSHFAVSNGFHYQDAPWSRRFHYDDPRLAETIDWLAGLPAKGLSGSHESTQSLGAAALFVAGKAAMVPEGSWMSGYFAGNAKFEFTWVPLPRGPSGRRASMLNGLADSIWSGSKVKEEAWQWVKYLASPECQRVVAAYGAVFPATEGLAEVAVEAQKRKGVDASAFLEMAREHTFLAPTSDDGAQIDAIVKGAVESVLLGREKALPALREANRRINNLPAR